MPLGRVTGVFGIRGWLRVRSDTDPPEGLLGYSPWSLRVGGDRREFQLLEGRRHGPGLVARLSGIADREQAGALVGCDVAVPRAWLPELSEGEYYWFDLVGLEVVTVDGCGLGRVERLMATGANDVLVVRGERERLIPYLPGTVVVDVDVGVGRIRVDWDPEF